MKKFFRIVLITMGVLVILLITFPILFKGKIEALVKDQVNQNIHARVDWSRFSMSLFRGFPDLSVNLFQVSVIGLDDFSGDTLVGLERFEFRVNPFGALKKTIEVKSILLDHPMINGIVLDNGTANWDIAPAEEGGSNPEHSPDVSESQSGQINESFESATGEGEKKSMAISLQRFAIVDGRVNYKDAAMDIEASMGDVDLELTGDFSMDQTDLELLISLQNSNVKYGGIRYLKEGNIGLDLVAEANMIENVYTLKKNEISLNGFVMGAEGTVGLLTDGAMDFDLRIFSRETSFYTLLSLIPAIYKKDFETLKTSGQLQLEGTVLGVMKDTILPDASLNLQVSDGYFAYPGLPKDVSDVQINLKVDYKGADLDASVIELERFHLLIGGNPFDLSMYIDRPGSDMNLSGKAVGSIDFASLRDVVPLEEVSLEGRMVTDLQWDTRLSYIEQEQYDLVDMDGKLIIEEVAIKTPEIPVPLDLTKLEMDFNPRVVDLVTLDMKLGSSDLHLDGELANFIPYVFANQTISGSLNVSSGLFDANEVMPEETENSLNEQADSQSETEYETAPPDSLAIPSQMKIPENIDFKMNLNMKKVTYDQIEVENIAGILRVNDGVAYLDDLTMAVIEGDVGIRGTVDTRGDFAEADVRLDMKGVDIPSSYETFVTVERLAPMAKYCKGTANADIQFQSLLDASFSPLYESINAKGRVFTRGLQIHNFNSFVKLSELLKNEKFRNMAPDEVDLELAVQDGRVNVAPFDMNFDDSKITASGSHGIDLTMDYLLDMKIAKGDLGEGANELMNGINALASGAGFHLPESDFVKVKAKITGTFRDPKISTDLSGNLRSTSETVKTAAKERVIEEVEKVEEQVRDEAGERANKIISEAEDEGKRLIDEAQRAGENLVKEAQVQGDKLIKEAGSNPLKKIAAKKAAEELNRQAKKQSENLVKEAESKANKIVEKARTEAEKI